jgi:AcrR family transcriptional regulator
MDSFPSSAQEVGGRLPAGLEDESVRPQRPSAARDRILATADRLFYTTGVRAVGVDRVIAESQVARMTFFRHFPTKDDLVASFLRRRVRIAEEELARVEAEHPGDPDHPARRVTAEHRAWITTKLCEALTQLGRPYPRTTAEALLMLRTGAIVGSSLEGLTTDEEAFLRTWWALVG